MSFAADPCVQGEAIGLGDSLQSGIRFVQGADGANHESLASLLRTDGDPVRYRTAQNLGHGIGIFGRIEVQPGALGVLFQQALAFQGATYTLADQLNQILQLTFIRRFDALEPRGLVVAIDVYAIQKQELTYLLTYGLK